MTEAANTAALLSHARGALETYHEVRVDDGGALFFEHSGIPWLVQAAQLAEGLVVLSLMCVVAVNLPDDAELALSAIDRASELPFGGTPVLSRNDGKMDLTLRYEFPAEGLSRDALGTLFGIMIGNSSKLRDSLSAPKGPRHRA
ncbi:hypothetical protein NLX83_17400 [Allokutzneria sp. A3M-2-11 16]|uniref:hypothetical protein n=1 Tax=Allokutzneria sp. A3M-2-11 16 TaxID=2962043 RepID=UPI0020B782FF|nr:hypothetical protein [Allokutzneria sp. A3M-2-11 16]MCP3801041.1 hypothetical protein [Allokutzneria sp. A3M-2-11 16]